MEIITGYTGEHHVTSADDASLYRSIIGPDDYVLNVGSKFEATIIDNNTVRIADGDLVIQGHQARIRANDYEEVTIDNGSPGQKRHDLIVARYQKDTVTGIESVTLEVVKGTPGTTATDPEIVQEDLTTGGTQRDFALYRVSLDGLALESVTSLFNVSSSLTQKANQSDFDDLRNTSEIIESGTNANGYYIRWANGLQLCYVSSLQISRVETRLQRSWTFPASFFYSNYYAGGHYLFHDKNVNSGAISSLMVTQRSLTSVTLVVEPLSGTPAFPAGSYISATVFAIGWWK